MTLDSKINKHLPNVAKSLQSGGYATAMIGKPHAEEKVRIEPLSLTCGIESDRQVASWGRYSA
jgi:arylsulfatase A-like enzyme